MQFDDTYIHTYIQNDYYCDDDDNLSVSIYTYMIIFSLTHVSFFPLSNDDDNNDNDDDILYD